MRSKTSSHLNAKSGLITKNTSAVQACYPFHPNVWVLWLPAALAPAILTKNPLYLLTLIIVVGVNYFSLDTKSPTAQGWRAFLSLGLILVIVSVVFNLLFVRAGTTPLFTLPTLHWETATERGQTTIIQIGGKVTLESLIYGLSTGLNLMAILLILAIFNTQVNHYQLLRRIPRFLYQSAIVMSIAITFIPHMFLAQREIRQAQTLRGHRFRGVRDLLPLFVTLLAEGLERSLTLAESMEARGFNSVVPGQRSQAGLLMKGVIALALIVLTGGAFAWSDATHKTVGGIMMLFGGGLLMLALWLIGRQVQRSRYHRTVWRRQDTTMTIATATTLGVVLITWLTQRSVFIFYPYPKLVWPSFSPIIGASLLLLMTPALLQFNKPTPSHALERSYD